MDFIPPQPTYTPPQPITNYPVPPQNPQPVEAPPEVPKPPKPESPAVIQRSAAAFDVYRRYVQLRNVSIIGMVSLLVSGYASRFQYGFIATVVFLAVFIFYLVISHKEMVRLNNTYKLNRSVTSIFG